MVPSQKGKEKPIKEPKPGGRDNKLKKKVDATPKPPIISTILPPSLLFATITRTNIGKHGLYLDHIAFILEFAISLTYYASILQC